MLAYRATRGFGLDDVVSASLFVGFWFLWDWSTKTETVLAKPAGTMCKVRLSRIASSDAFNLRV